MSALKKYREINFGIQELEHGHGVGIYRPATAT
jgi:hypothetical protein